VKLTTGFESRKSRIEMVPLIDVMFLLLASFVYGAMSMTQHEVLPVRLPQASGEKQVLEGFAIAISSDNTISIAGRVVTIEAAVAEAVAAKQNGAQVILSGDRVSDLGVALSLLSELRKGGVPSVSFQVEHKP
jgi:biopolymer transport protein ExbD